MYEFYKIIIGACCVFKEIHVVGASRGNKNIGTACKTVVFSAYIRHIRFLLINFLNLIFLNNIKLINEFISVI